MMKSLFYKGFFVFLILFLSVSIVQGVGLLSMPIEEIVYQPGGEEEYIFYVRNYNYDVETYASGDIAEYTEISPLVDIGGMKQFNVKLRFPSTVTLEPGTHTLKIGVTEVGETAGTIGVLTGAQRNLNVEVYSNDKDIKASFDAPNANENEIMLFRIELQSYSYQDIDSVYSEITIRDLDNNSLATFETNKVDLKSGEKKNIIAEWDNKGLSPGEYNAEAIIYFDEKQKNLNDSFKLGELKVKINNYTSYFASEQIDEFSLGVENVWNNPVENVFADLVIDNNKVLQTPSTNLNPWDEKTISTFWNVSYSPGNYSGKIILYYADTLSEKNINVVIYETKEKFKWQTLIIIVLILLLLLIISRILLFNNKRNRKKK